MTKKIKKIALFDVDGTIKDSFDSWAESAVETIDKFAEVRAKARNEKKEDIISAIDKELQSIYVLNWFTNFGYIPANLKALKAQNPEEEKLFSKEDALIVDASDKHRLNSTKAFKGSIQTLRKLKERGAKVVFLTDASRIDLITSFYLMKVPTDCIDAVYCLPDDPSKKNDPIMQKEGLDYYNTLAEKIIYTEEHKPSPKIVGIILKAFNLKPEDAVLIGDNKDDALSCKPAGVDFVWQKEGAKLNEVTEHFSNVRLDGGPRKYMIGLDITIAKLKKAAEDTGIKGLWPPDLTLENGFKDNTLMNTYHFEAPEKSEKTTFISDTVKKNAKSR